MRAIASQIDLTLQIKMLILIIILSFLITITIFSKNNQKNCFRSSFVKASIVYEILIIASTEFFSVFHTLNIQSLALLWLSILAINIFWAIKSLIPINLSGLRFTSLRSLNSENLIAAISSVLILGITLTTALIAAPNNWDAMTYHMPRVMHWIQNEAVNHYPTNNLRQISLSPGAGYVVTQVQILAGSDRFANCIQWLAFFGSSLGISLISEKFIGHSARWISLLTCLSLPMAIMQSTTTQTDLFLTYWLVCLTYFIFRATHYQTRDYAWIAASLSLSIVSKPTAFIFSFPLVIAFIFRALIQTNLSQYSQNSRKIIRTASLLIFSLSSSLLLSIPTFWRNYQVFNKILGPDFDTKNEALGILPLISNALKNLAINLPIPGFWQLVNFLHVHLLGISINDKRFNYTPAPENNAEAYLAMLKSLAPHEDHVGNPIHMILIVLSLFSLFYFFRRLKTTVKNHDLLILTTSNLLGFLFFCLLLKWQSWSNRILLPLFILNVPIINYFLICIIPKIWRKLILVLLGIVAILYALMPIRHPLIAFPISSDEQSASILTLPRSELYFSGARKELRIPYKTAIALIEEHQCRSVGLALEGDDWEYPLWVLMSQQHSSFQMKHINVTNESQISPSEFSDQQICAVISTIPDYQPNLSLHKSFSWKDISVSTEPFIKVFLINSQQNRTAI